MKSIIFILALALCFQSNAADTEYGRNLNGDPIGNPKLLNGTAETGSAIWKGIKKTGAVIGSVGKFFVVDLPVGAVAGFNTAEDKVGRSFSVDYVDPADSSIRRKITYTSQGYIKLDRNKDGVTDKVDPDMNMGHVRFKVSADDGGDISLDEISVSFLTWARMKRNLKGDMVYTGSKWTIYSGGKKSRDEFNTDNTDAQYYFNFVEWDYAENMIVLDDGSRFTFKLQFDLGGIVNKRDDDDQEAVIKYGISLGYSNRKLFKGYDASLEFNHLVQLEDQGNDQVTLEKNSVSLSVFNVKNRQGEGLSYQLEFGNEEANSPGSDGLLGGDFVTGKINYGF